MTGPNTTPEDKMASQEVNAANLRTQRQGSPFETLRNVVFGFLVAFLIFLLFEGVCSITLAIRDFAAAPIMAERLHTRYDSELGWSNVPGIYIPDMYGTSKYVKINSQGYRSNEDFSQKVPAGKLRVLCSGDSFTFGYGVSNDETWCQTLESRDRRLQTVNMGQGGFGADQIFLWYRRDIDRLNADVHVVAVIGDDFDRMQSDEFLGYKKPVLRLDQGQLVAGNTPVPKGLWRARLVSIYQRLDQVRSISVLRRLIRKFKRFTPARHDAASGVPSQSAAQQRQVVLRMLDSFRDLDRSRNRVFVFVYLPTEGECYRSESKDWRQWIGAEASARSIAVIDLLPDFLALPVRQVGEMFIQQDSTKYIEAKGHYSVAGNRFVAERIYSRLLSIPEVKRKIESVSPE
ncbi:MAG: hypothetical protein ABSG79_07770 [Bryobacteraceae bacterium]|jgi:hypothetical protein